MRTWREMTVETFTLYTFSHMKIFFASFYHYSKELPVPSPPQPPTRSSPPQASPHSKHLWDLCLPDMFAFCICDMFENPHFCRSFEFRGFGVRFCQALRRVQGDLLWMGCLVEAANRKLCQVMAPFTKTNLGLPILMQSLSYLLFILSNIIKCARGTQTGVFHICILYIHIYLWSQSRFLLSVWPFWKIITLRATFVLCGCRKVLNTVTYI